MIRRLLSALCVVPGAVLVVAGCAQKSALSVPEDRPQDANGYQNSLQPGVSAFGAATPMPEALQPGGDEPPPVSQAVIPPPPEPRQLPPAEQRHLELHLAAQRFVYFEDGRPVWSGRISSGADAHPTPRGRFRITAKDADKRSGSYTNYFDRPTPMPYAMQFHGPYWLHEGYVPHGAASHGCVRLRHEDARFLFARMRVGDPVTVVE